MFETVLFNIIKVLTSGLEMIFAFILLSRFFEQKNFKPYIYRIAYAVSTGIIVVLQETGYLGSLKTITEIIIIIVLSITLFTGKLRERVVFLVIFSLMLSLTQLLSVFALNWLSDNMTLSSESFFFRVLTLEMPYLLMFIFVMLFSIFMRKRTGNINILEWIMLLSVPVTVLATLTVYEYYIEMMPPNEEINSYIYISTGGLLFITTLTFTLFSKFRRQLKIAENTKDLRMQIALQEQSVKRMEVAYNRTREIRHDLKNHIAGMYGLLNSGDYDGLRKYLNAMNDTVEDSTYIAVCNNSAIDAILNEKLYIAQKKTVHIQYDICDLSCTSIGTIDICIILANAIDNAIEACEKIEDEKERYIQIRVTDEDFMLFSVTNPVAYTPQKSADGLYVSDKNDTGNHGIGMKSIKSTAEKYGGDMVAKCENNIFTLVVKLNHPKQ